MKTIQITHTITYVSFFLLQIRPANSCSFVRITGEFMAAVKFRIKVESEELCLGVCVDELDCTFVEYSERNCTIFIDGNSRVVSDGSLLKFERDVPRPTCSKTIKFGLPVQFQQIAIDKVNNATCSGPPTPNTTIYIFYDSNNYRFYAKDDEDFFDGMTQRHRRCDYHSLLSKVFARNAQPNCTSIPVFARAGRRRLFFGNVYNTTGYTFMNAYAFASKCACESGACCGSKGIRERYIYSRSYAYWNTEDTGAPLTDINQTFFIADHSKF